MSPSPRWRSEALAHFGVLVGMGLLALFLLWPLATDMLGTVPLHYQDPLMDSWSIWWMRQALWEHPQNPFVSPIVNYPMGAPMYWHNLEPAKTIWGVVLLPLMRPETARNLLVWTTFPLAGYTAWLLTRYVLLREGVARHVAGGAAFAGGCVYAFSRYHLCHAAAHLNLSSIEGIPLYLYFLVRFLDRGRVGDLVGVALAAVYTAFCDSYYLVYAAVFSVFWVVAEAERNGGLFGWAVLRRPLMWRAWLAATAATAALSPWLWTLYKHAYPPPVSVNHGDADFLADLAGYLIPDRGSLWLTKVPAKWQALSLRLPGNTEEDGYFLGYVTPLLGFAGARCFFLRDGRRWLIIGVAFLVLSLGIELNVADQHELDVWIVLAFMLFLVTVTRAKTPSPLSRDLWIGLALLTALTYVEPVTANGRDLKVRLTLPYALFKTAVPFFGRGGMSDRMVLGASLALGVLFAVFAAWAASKVRHKPLALVLAVALGAIPCLEYRGQPIAMGPVPRQFDVFETIRQEPPETAVFTEANVESQFEQTYHGHPVSFVRLARVPVDVQAFLNSHRLYMALGSGLTLTSPVSAAESSEMRAFLREHHFRYYLEHTFDPARDRFLTTYLGAHLLSREDPKGGRPVDWVSGMVAYRFDEASGK